MDKRNRVYWLTGLSGAGKTTIGRLWYEELKRSGEKVVLLDGITVVCCTISMFRSVREWTRANIPGYFEVYIQASMETLRQRDQKGLYSQNVENVAGVGLQVELPDTPDLILDNNGQRVPEEQVAILRRGLEEAE